MKLLVLLVSVLLSNCSGNNPVETLQESESQVVLNPLEDVPYDVLGRGILAFERIASEGTESGVFFIDTNARSNWSIGYLGHSAQISPDGSQLAYTALTPWRSDNWTFWDPHVCDLQGHDERVVAGISGNHGPLTWTPDGETLVFGGMISGGMRTGVFRVNVAAGFVQTIQPGLCTHISGFEPISVRPDGRMVTVGQTGWMGPTCRYNAPRLLIFDRSNAPPDSLLLQHEGRVHWPTWAHDGLRIAYLEVDEDARRTRLFVVNADGSGLTRIFDRVGGQPTNWSGSGNRSVAWSPDDRHLAFTHSETDAEQHIYLISVEGGDPVRITRAAGAHDRSVSWVDPD